MCTQSSQIIAKMLSGLTGQENQPYVADLYDNLTFHQKNVSTLLTALNSETSASITDAKRMDYYRKYDATMQQNIQQSIQQLQSVQTNMDPTLYATFLTTFQSLQKQYNQLPT